MTEMFADDAVKLLTYDHVERVIINVWY